MIRTMGIAGLLALGGIAGAALAEDPESVVNWRKNTIGAAGRAAVALNDIRKGDLEEQDRITEIAEMMVISAKLAKEAFRHDTRGASVETTAKDTIWTNWDDFSKRMDDYVADTEKVAELARAGDQGAMFKQLGQTFRNCKGCHDTYRTK